MISSNILMYINKSIILALMIVLSLALILLINKFMFFVIGIKIVNKKFFFKIISIVLLLIGLGLIIQEFGIGISTGEFYENMFALTKGNKMSMISQFKMSYGRNNSNYVNLMSGLKTGIENGHILGTDYYIMKGSSVLHQLENEQEKLAREFLVSLDNCKFNAMPLNALYKSPKNHHYVLLKIMSVNGEFFADLRTLTSSSDIDIECKGYQKAIIFTPELNLIGLKQTQFLTTTSLRFPLNLARSFSENLALYTPMKLNTVDLTNFYQNLPKFITESYASFGEYCIRKLEPQLISEKVIRFEKIDGKIKVYLESIKGEKIEFKCCSPSGKGRFYFK